MCSRTVDNHAGVDSDIVAGAAEVAVGCSGEEDGEILVVGGGGVVAKRDTLDLTTRETGFGQFGSSEYALAERIAPSGGNKDTGGSVGLVGEHHAAGVGCVTLNTGETNRGERDAVPGTILLVARAEGADHDGVVGVRIEVGEEVGELRSGVVSNLGVEAVVADVLEGIGVAIVAIDVVAPFDVGSLCAHGFCHH